VARYSYYESGRYEHAHVVLNIREDLMPQFKMDGTFRAEVPAIGKKDVEFRIYYISPLGSFATGNQLNRQEAMTCRHLRYTPVLPKKLKDCVGNVSAIDHK
jgi:hypothetical protein